MPYRLRMKPKSTCFHFRKTPDFLAILTMAQPKLAKGSVASIAANTAHRELSQFVEREYPDVVNKKPDQILKFNLYLKTPELQETNMLVTDFLNVSSALRIL
jgi:hypothetical protein